MTETDTQRARPPAAPPHIEPASRDPGWRALDPGDGPAAALPSARWAVMVAAILIIAVLAWSSQVALPVVVIADGVVRHDGDPLMVASGAAGRVARLEVGPGAFVDGGQPLARIATASGGAAMPVIAPRAGIVVRTRAEGAVVSAATPVAEIMPFGSPLVVEGRLTPPELSAVQVGQPVRIRPVSGNRASPPPRGRLVRLSGAVLGEDGTPVAYRVLIALEQGPSGDAPVAAGLAVGTRVRADIVTGYRSLLAYLVVPVRFIGARAFREP